MINKHSRESSRVRSRRRRENLIRGICISAATLMLAAAAFWFLRHGMNPNRGRGSSPEVAIDRPASNNSGKWNEDVKSRTVVASVIFGEHDVIALNANGEEVPGGQLRFTKAAPGPAESRKPKPKMPALPDAGSMARKASDDPDAKEKTVAADTSAERTASDTQE